MPRAGPRALSKSFPQISQVKQVAQHGRSRAMPPRRDFCSGLSKRLFVTLVFM